MHGGELSARIRQLQEGPLEVKSAALGRDLPFIEIKTEAVPESEWAAAGKREFTLTAKIGAKAPVGVYDEWIWVNTNITRYANMPVKLKGTVVGPYDVSPRSVAERLRSASFDRTPGCRQVTTMSSSTGLSTPVHICEGRDG